MEKVKEEHGEDSLQYQVSKGVLINFHMGCGRFEIAEQYLEETYNGFLQNGEQGVRMASGELGRLGNVKFMQDKYEEAEDLYLRALEQ